MSATKRRHTAADTAADTHRLAIPAHLRARLYDAFEPVVRAVLDAAIGVRHLYAKDATTGQWARVTDPDTITALLNARPADRDADEPTLVIYTQDPDAPLLEALLAFQLGPPFDPARVPALTQPQLEAMATAGVFDGCFGTERRGALWAVGAAVQSRPGRLEGIVTDSLNLVKPVAGAQVSATRVGAHRETTFVALTDDRGRFAFERLDAGEYAVGFASHVGSYEL